MRGAKWRKLREISAITYGYTERATSNAIGPRFLRITDIQLDKVDWQSVPYCRIDSVDLPKYRLASGDIVFARTGATTGKSFLVSDPPEAVFASYLIRLRLLDKELLPEFVSLFFQTTGYWKSINQGSSGSAQEGFNATKLGALSIPVPSLLEQRRIIALLDDAFASVAIAKANAETNLRNVRALYDSHSEAVLASDGEGWTRKPFSALCDIKHGFAFEGQFFSSEGEHVLLTPGNFYEQGGYRDRGAKQKYYNGVIPTEFLLSRGDLLVAMTEQAPGLLGSPIIVPASGEFLHNQRLGLVKTKPGVQLTNEFLYFLFNSKSVRAAIHATASGVKVRHTSPAKIGEVVVSFPTSDAEQRAIVSNLTQLRDQTERLRMIYLQKVEALDTLRRSLLDQAFTELL